MNRERTTGIRVNLTPTNCTTEEVKNWMAAQRSLTNFASTNLLRLMKENPAHAEAVFSNKSHYLAYVVHHQILLKETSFREERIRLGLRTSTNERLAAAIAGRFYNGYGQRNGGKQGDIWTAKLPKLPACTRQNKAIHVKDAVLRKFVDGDTITFSEPQKNRMVKLENVRFELQGLFGKIYNFTGEIPAYQTRLLQFLSNKKNVDCNIFVTKKGHITLVIRVEEIYELAYEPEKTLGIDFNKRPSVFATMSDGDILPLTVDMSLAIKEVQWTDEQIGLATKSSQRRKFRYHWKQARKNLARILKPLVDSIILKAKDNQYLLAIDGVTQAQGSFGHAEMKEELVKRCKTERIPFIIVPSAHTSSDCAECYSRTAQYNQVARSKDFELVSCNVCEKNYHADINAAKNISHDGTFIFHATKSDLPKDKFGRAIRSGRPSTSVAKRMKKMQFVMYDTTL
jgi:transposase